MRRHVSAKKHISRKKIDMQIGILSNEEDKDYTLEIKITRCEHTFGIVTSDQYFNHFVALRPNACTDTFFEHKPPSSVTFVALCNHGSFTSGETYQLIFNADTEAAWGFYVYEKLTPILLELAHERTSKRKKSKQDTPLECPVVSI